MSYKLWNLEYQKILTTYKILSARGYKELVIDTINVLLNNKVNEEIDLTSKIQELKNIKSNLENSLENDKEMALKNMIF